MWGATTTIAAAPQVRSLTSTKVTKQMPRRVAPINFKSPGGVGHALAVDNLTVRDALAGIAAGKLCVSEVANRSTYGARKPTGGQLTKVTGFELPIIRIALTAEPIGPNVRSKANVANVESDTISVQHNNVPKFAQFIHKNGRARGKIGQDM